MNDGMVSINPNDLEPIREVKDRVFISGHQLFSYFPSKWWTVLLCAVYVINGEDYILSILGVGMYGSTIEEGAAAWADVLGFFNDFYFSHQNR